MPSNKSTGMRSLSAAPMTLDRIISKLERARDLWGGSTCVGICLSGSSVQLPCLDVLVSETKQRVSIVANFSDNSKAILDNSQATMSPYDQARRVKPK